MVARNLFILFLNQGAGLKFRLVAANLLIELGLFLFGSSYRRLLRTKLILELPKLRCVCTFGCYLSLGIGGRVSLHGLGRAAYDFCP